MAAILDLGTLGIPKWFNMHSIGLVMQILCEKDTLFVILTYLGPDIWIFMFLKMAAGGHFENGRHFLSQVESEMALHLKMITRV